MNTITTKNKIYRIYRTSKVDVSNIPSWKCKDCLKPVYSEYYMVHNYIWNEAHQLNESKKGMLCISCLESRIDRILTPIDFTTCPLNSTQIKDKSPTLLNRLGLD